MSPTIRKKRWLFRTGSLSSFRISRTIGAPHEFYDRPRSAFVADFVGAANLIRGTLRRYRTSEGFVVLETASGVCVQGYENGRHVGTEGAFSVRTSIRGRAANSHALPSTPWQVRISRRVFLGDFVQYLVESAGHQLVVRVPDGTLRRRRAGVSWYRPRTLCVVRGIRSLKRAPYWGHMA